MGKKAGKFWRDLFAKFPSLDPESVEHYDEGVDSSDVVQWIGENAEDIRKTIAGGCVAGDVSFTPGPWHARLSDNGIWFHIHCEGPRIIASMDAAPELYKAVEEAWFFIENVTDDDPQRADTFFALRQKVRDAFMKACGEG